MLACCVDLILSYYTCVCVQYWSYVVKYHCPQLILFVTGMNNLMCNVGEARNDIMKHIRKRGVTWYVL